jgi:hypothetical protein
MVVFNWLINSYIHFLAGQVIHSQIRNGHGQSIGIGILVLSMGMGERGHNP